MVCIVGIPAAITTDVDAFLFVPGDYLWQALHIIDRKGFPPVPLSAEDGIPEPIVYFSLALSQGLQPIDGPLAGLPLGEPIQKVRIGDHGRSLVDKNMDGLVDDLGSLTDLEDDAVHPHDQVDRLQGAVLTGNDVPGHPFRDPGDGGSGDLEVVYFPYLLLDVTVGHSLGIEGHDHVLDPVDHVAPLGHDGGTKEASRSLGTWIRDSPKEVRTVLAQYPLRALGLAQRSFLP